MKRLIEKQNFTTVKRHINNNRTISTIITTTTIIITIIIDFKYLYEQCNASADADLCAVLQ
jgi:hypothetical protein